MCTGVFADVYFFMTWATPAAGGTVTVTQSNSHSKLNFEMIRVTASGMMLSMTNLGS